MKEKRFQKTRIVDKWGGIYDSKTDKVLSVNDVEHKLNEQQSIIEQLRTQLLICQQSKNDDGRIKVWQVPPIQEGMRITISSGEKDE